ncbi:hypothetical protein [Lysobacter capsici]|uniref:hypothetical protein n=1 Tax=Lysobacter capsici TaxID=435897 RepID=UPI000BBB0EAB|nr:hypothetical protein [Lysobacter capsici]ATE72321.1 hypothetical protein CNO08_13760 [Lysobacter capsici]
MPSSKRYLVVSADLDKSRHARLHAACVGLREQGIEIDLQAWSDRPAHLLVTGTETSLSRNAVEQAMRRGIPVLRIGRLPWDPDSVHSVDINIEAGELGRSLRERLRHGRDDAEANGASAAGALPFVQHLLSAPKGLYLFESGLFRLVADLGASRMHMIRRMPYPELVAEAMSPNWFITALTQKQYVEKYRQDVTQSYSLESLLWDIAIGHDAPLAQVDALRPLQLRGWPLMPSTALPTQWLLPLGCLLRGPWSLPALAEATATPHAELKRLFAVALATGLAEAAPATMPAHRQGGSSELGLIRRLARRFGLNFLGAGSGQ